MTLTPDQLRGDVIAAVPPPFGRAEYAVTDPDFIDPCITEAIRTSRDRKSAVADAVLRVQTKLATPDGLARIAKRVEQRYQHPVITRDGDRVTIDAGVIAAPLNVFRAELVVDDSPNIDRGEWATAEVVKFLKLGMAQDAASYRAVVQIPRRSLGPEWVYVYDRRADRIEVANGGRMGVSYVTEKLGGDPAHAASLHSSKLTAERR